MKMNNEKDEKICWIPGCKRNLVGESKFGLCPVCFNKYGSWGAVLGIGGISSLGGRWVWKNGGKVAKGAFDVIKNIKL